MTVAALYVDAQGIYSRLLGPEHCWSESRDARNYRGPHPVVAHPPCERWGTYANGGPGFRGLVRPVPGDDGGCFAAALACVLGYGGVLEHPAGSLAWQGFGLKTPPKEGGWIPTLGGHTCRVEQGRYGHRAKKATWLFAVSAWLPELDWGVTPPDPTLTPRQRKTGVCQRLSKKQRAATPEAFASLLIAVAESAAQPGQVSSPIAAR